MAKTYSGVDNLQAMKVATNYNQHLAKLVRQGASVIERPPNAVLDFGAGAGTFAQLLSPTMDPILCLEPDPRMATILRGAGFSVASALGEIEENSLDYIYSLNVLEHIEDHEWVLEQLARKLRSGGGIFIYLPAFQCLFSSMDTKVGHYRRYSLRGLCGLMRNAGFSVAYSKYCDSLGFFATLAYKMLGRGTGELSARSVYSYDRYFFPFSRSLDLVLEGMFGKNVYAVGIKK